MITEETVRKIIRKYLQGRATDRERALLENWYYEQGRQRPLNEADLRFLLDGDAIMEGVRRRAGLTVKNRQGRRILRWLPYAAAGIVLALSITWIFYADQNNKEPAMVVARGDISSGGNRATLKLADGRQIDLSQTQSGIVVGEERISYEGGTEELVTLHVDEVTAPMELTVPKGGTYQISLADGTKVWLNSASKLKYPSHFDSKERVVELEGEAYFSVAKGGSGRWPFRVTVAGQTVEVFGTEFNVSAYPGEPEKTTLVEGSVSVTNHYSNAVNRILPGEQAIVNGATSDIVSVDVRKYTAWKDGLFYFKQTPFDELILEIARWYDVGIVYRGAVPNETFSGKMRRELSLMTVLDLLDVSTKAKIHLEGRTLIIQ